MAKPDSHESFGRHPHSSSSTPLSDEQLRRVELLKLTKELQRKEKERAAWRAASEPRNIFHDETRIVPSQKPAQAPEVKPNKGESTFFAKLRLGKFLE